MSGKEDLFNTKTPLYKFFHLENDTEKEEALNKLFEMPKPTVARMSVVDEIYGIPFDVFAKQYRKNKQRIAVAFFFSELPTISVKIEGDFQKDTFRELAESIAQLRKTFNPLSFTQSIYKKILPAVRVKYKKDALINFFADKHGGIKNVLTDIFISCSGLPNVDAHFNVDVILNNATAFSTDKVVFNDATVSSGVISNSFFIYKTSEKVSAERSPFAVKDVFTNKLTQADGIVQMMAGAVPLEELHEFIFKYLPEKFNFKVIPCKEKHKGDKEIVYAAGKPYEIQGKLSIDESLTLDRIFDAYTKQYYTNTVERESSEKEINL